MSQTARMALLAMLFFTVLFSAWTAHADRQSKSYSSWIIEHDAQQRQLNISGQINVPAYEMTRLPIYRTQPQGKVLLKQLLPQWLELRGDNKQCALEGQPQPLHAETGYLRFEMRFTCPPETRALEIINTGFFKDVPSHLHFARFVLPGEGLAEHLYSRRNTSHTLNLADDERTNAEPLSEVFVEYLRFGFEHILIGVDHIAFLLGLMLLAVRLRDLVFIATGFTIGHSITLSLAALELVEPDTHLVEALIGFTVALVAIEGLAVKSGKNREAALALAGLFVAAALLRPLIGAGPSLLNLLGLGLFSGCYLLFCDSAKQADKLRPALTAAFGLVHGFGFAGVLLEVGLPKGSIVPALLGFNLGVELGQLALIAVLGWLALRLTRRDRLSVDIMLATLCALGVFWFVERGW